MKKVYLLLLLVLSGIKLNAQNNLVPNPSFEVYDTCPSVALSLGYNHLIYWAVPWTQPYTPENSTDFFHNCDSITGILGTPSNSAGYQVPHSGSGYAGFAPMYFVGNNYREYLEVELTDSLITGMRYCVSFYISFSDLSKRSCDGIGAYLSDTLVHYDFPDWGVLNLPAQVKNPAGNIISDTANWVLISDTIIANGGEKFLTIGNFNDDSSTNFVLNTYGTHNYSYYYIDDVSVMLCDSTIGITESNKSNISIFPNPAYDLIYIKSPISNNPFEVVITDITGKTVFRNHFSGKFSTETIDISSQQPGIYLIQVFDNRLLNYSGKLVIVR